MTPKGWRQFPVAILGFVAGKMRLESLDDDWYPWRDKVLLFNDGTDSWHGDHFGVTHIQYQSRFGFLLMWPFCFHIWIMSDLGKFIGGRHVQGTEKGWYFRFGFVWRKTKYEPTWYGPFNRHWD